ncbi:hypothetical protein [Kitasatospora kazusensis]
MSLDARRLPAQWRAGTEVDVMRAVASYVRRPESARATSSA